MSFHGGFLGCCVKAMFGRFHGIPLLMLGDLLALATPPGLFLVGVANFINAELWGRPTDVPWGVVFPGARAQNCPDVLGLCARHPSQLYEAAMEGIILFILLFFLALVGFLRRHGCIMGIFFFGYGLLIYLGVFALRIHSLSLLIICWVMYLYLVILA